MAAHAADPAVEIVTQNNVSAAEKTAANLSDLFPRIEIFTQFHTGYDDNIRTTGSGKGAFFTEEQLTLSYRLPSRRIQLSLVAGVGSTNYLEQRNDTNFFFDLSLSRHLTRRLTLSASLDGAYKSEPTFTQNVGPNQFQGNYFDLNNKLWASYLLTRRFSLVSSYSLHLVRYEDPATAFFTDREEHTFGEQLRFILTRTTVLTGEYRFLLVDYVTYPLDSETHFALLGIEHSFNSRLRGQVRGGLSFRSFQQGGNQINPNFEGSLDYAISGHTALNWTGSYSVEAPTERSVVSRTTLRTGLQLTQSFTKRINVSLGIAYHHDENQQGMTFLNMGPTFSEDTFDVTLNLRYQFSHRVAFDLGVNHSEIMSGQAGRDYSRNRYSVGFSYSF